MKSTGIAYLLWFFTGVFGGHRFYAGKKSSAIIMAAIGLLGVIGLGSAIGTLLSLSSSQIMYAGVLKLVLQQGALATVGIAAYAVVGLWALVDAFLIPGMLRQANGGAAGAPQRAVAAAA